MKINFCGDSFCRDYNTPDKTKARPNSYVQLLSKKLNAKLIGIGGSGTAHEHTFRTFDPKAEYTVFCWTEAHRLYHPTHRINMARCEDYKDSDPVYAAGYDYYKYIHDWDYMSTLQSREFFWFDHSILSKYKGKAVHLYSFRVPPYKFKHGIDTRMTLFQYKIKNDYANHMSEAKNIQLSEYLYKLLKG